MTGPTAGSEVRSKGLGRSTAHSGSSRLRGKGVGASPAQRSLARAPPCGQTAPGRGRHASWRAGRLTVLGDVDGHENAPASSLIRALPTPLKARQWAVLQYQPHPSLVARTHNEV